MTNVRPNHPDRKLCTEWIGHMTDITAQVKAEKALSVAREAAVRRTLDVEEAQKRRQIAEEQKADQEYVLCPNVYLLTQSSFTECSLILHHTS